MKKRYSLPMLVAGTVAALLTLAACGSSSGGSSSGDTAAATGANSAPATGGATGSLQKITVGVIPIPDTAPLYLGVKQGIFAKQGLDVKIQNTTGGADAVPGVVSGTYNFAFGNYISLMIAQDKGFDLKYVANGDDAAGDPGFQAVVVPKDSPITSLKELAGKKVSVNNLSNINDTTIRALVDKAGGDASTIHFVAIPFPNAVAAIKGKQVDAGTVNPWLSSMSSDFRVLAYNFYDFDPDLDVAGYFTKGSTIKNDPTLVTKFTTAMNESLTYAQAHPDEVRAIIQTYTKFTADQLKDLVLPKFGTDFHRDALQKLADAALKYGTVKKAVDLDALLPAS